MSTAALHEVTQHLPGTFSWIDLSTTDQVGATRFYSALFGWTHRDDPIDENSHYTMFYRHDKAVAGAGSMPAEQRAQGVPSHWNSYVTVANVDATVDKAQSLGGIVIAPAFDVMDAGRMAVIQDPTGAIFCVWEARDHIGAGLLNAHGALVWNELTTPDTDVASAFYAGLFGWSSQAGQALPNGHPYLMLTLGDHTVGGMLRLTPDMGEMPPHWSVFINVEDCDATLAKAESLGATALMPPFDAGAGRLTALQDPYGAVFFIIEANFVSA